MGLLDVAAAGAPVWVVAGPIDNLDRLQFAELLKRMAMHGPLHRIGLNPTRGSHHWTYSDGPDSDAELTCDLAGVDTAEAMFGRVLGTIPQGPVTLGRSGDYAVVCFDHGIGDSHVMMEVIAAITRGDAPDGFAESVPQPTTNRPLVPALRHYAVTAKGVPRQRMFRSAVELVSSRLRTEGPARKTTPARGYQAIVVTSEPGLVGAIGAWRRDHHPQASITGLVIHAVHRAMRNAGIPVVHEVEVLVDLRRFLPDSVRTLANFCTITRVDTGDGSCEYFSDELRRQSESVRPLLILAAAMSVTRLKLALGRRLRQRWWTSGESVDTSSVQLTVSDISKIPSRTKLAWARPDDAVLAVALPPGTGRHVSVAVWTSTSGAVQATATFAAGLVEPTTLRAALTNALSVEPFCGM